MVFSSTRDDGFGMLDWTIFIYKKTDIFRYGPGDCVALNANGFKGMMERKSQVFPVFHNLDEFKIGRIVVTVAIDTPALFASWPMRSNFLSVFIPIYFLLIQKCLINCNAKSSAIVGQLPSGYSEIRPA